MERRRWRCAAESPRTGLQIEHGDELVAADGELAMLREADASLVGRALEYHQRLAERVLLLFEHVVHLR